MDKELLGAGWGGGGVSWSALVGSALVGSALAFWMQSKS